MGDTFGKMAIIGHLIQTESNGACKNAMRKLSLFARRR
jgi:hypothetical protein